MTEIKLNTPSSPTVGGVNVTDDMAIAFHSALTDGAIGSKELEEIKTGLRAALAEYIPILPTQGEGETPETDAAKAWSAERGWPIGTHPMSEIFQRMMSIEIRLRTIVAGMPKEWDAETIKDAPEGRYRVTNPRTGEWEDINHGLRSVQDGIMVGQRAFGPIPQPPTTPTGEAGKETP